MKYETRPLMIPGTESSLTGAQLAQEMPLIPVLPLKDIDEFVAVKIPITMGVAFDTLFAALSAAQQEIFLKTFHRAGKQGGSKARLNRLIRWVKKESSRYGHLKSLLLPLLLRVRATFESEGCPVELMDYSLIRYPDSAFTLTIYCYELDGVTLDNILLRTFEVCVQQGLLSAES